MYDITRTYRAKLHILKIGSDWANNLFLVEVDKLRGKVLARNELATCKLLIIDQIDATRACIRNPFVEGGGKENIPTNHYFFLFVARLADNSLYVFKRQIKNYLWYRLLEASNAYAD